jgi:hypothetical protein
MSSGERQTVAVAVESASTPLGGTVTAVVTITGNADRKVRGAKAQLVRHTLHRYIQQDVLLSRGEHDTLLREDIVVTETPITSSDGKVLPGEHVVRLHVPEDGLPSATDQVTWSVRAIIDRRHGTDVTAQAPVQVLAGPDRFASEATEQARYKGAACIDLELSTRTLRPGQTITGTVVLRPAQAMTLTKVLLGFVETTPVKKGLKNTPVAFLTLLDEPLELAPGQTRKLPFELTLPADAAPTVRGSMTTAPCHSVISWQVGAQAKSAPPVGDKTGTDGFVYLGINVYNYDPAPAAPPRQP